jgi:hypothetical protein
MTTREIVRQRLFNQHVCGTPFSSPAEAVRHLGAVQAQDYRAGLWGVGLRTKEAVEPTIERALADRTIVRTWPMRGTLHFVAAEDVRWMLPLLTPRIAARATGRHRELGLERSLFPRCRKLFEKALQGGGQRTRDEMYGLLRNAGISPDGQRGIHILQQLAQDGILCFGPRRGKQQTFVLLDEWIPRTSPRPREEALADLAQRYFSGHGPATVQDFGWWSGLPAADAKRALESSSPRLVRVSADGREYWGPGAEPPRHTQIREAVLLPPFDELLVAYKDRSPAVDPAQAGHLPSLLSPTITVKGRIVGTWTRTLAKDKAVIVPRFFGRPGTAELRSIEEAVRRYGTFLGVAAEMRQP